MHGIPFWAFLTPVELCSHVQNRRKSHSSFQRCTITFCNASSQVLCTEGLGSSSLLANAVASKDSMVNLYKSKSCSGVPFKQGSLGVAVEFDVVAKCSGSALGSWVSLATHVFGKHFKILKWKAQYSYNIGHQKKNLLFSSSSIKIVKKRLSAVGDHPKGDPSGGTGYCQATLREKQTLLYPCSQQVF